MKTHAKAEKKNPRSVEPRESVRSQNSMDPALRIADGQPRTDAPGQMMAMAGNSPQSRQLKRLQHVADQSPRVEQAVLRQTTAGQETSTAEQKIHAGLPGDLIASIESLSGVDMSDVTVHRNSSRPAELQAHAYAQGNDIRLAPGQEAHLPHEAWHVVQQKQGRVKPTLTVPGSAPINDDPMLEHEADTMGKMALELTAQFKRERQADALELPDTAQRRATTPAHGEDNRTETDRLSSLQEMANNSPQSLRLRATSELIEGYVGAGGTALAPAATKPALLTDSNGQVQPMRMEARQSSNNACVQLKGKSKSWKRRRKARLAQEEKWRQAAAAHHAADTARMQALRDAKTDGPIMDTIDFDPRGSATLTHLKTPFVDRAMNVRGANSDGVRKRFLTPTNPVASQQDASKKREISPEQVEKYKGITERVVDTERHMKATHYPFYHAQDPRMRIAQDVYKRVYARHHDVDVPPDFHFLRFPGPDDDEFKTHKNVQSYFEQDMKQHGMIDDNITPTKTHLISVNPALHGGLNHAGEETFHYFQIGQGQTPLPVAAIMRAFLEKFKLDASGVEALYESASGLNATKEGSLFQFMVPKDNVDDVAYMAHPHGLPHDDELFDDLHEMGGIRYVEPSSRAPGDDAWMPPREKMNDEVTRNLVAMREAWQLPEVQSPDPVHHQHPGAGISAETLKEASGLIGTRGAQRRIAFLQQQTKALNQRTLDRFKEGHYAPSHYLDDFAMHPAVLQHPEGHAQRLRMQSNPDHFGGQGLRSHHELMRIENRSTFMQARMHLSEAHTLNPRSGVLINRYTTMEPDKEAEYNKMLDEYVIGLFSKK